MIPLIPIDASILMKGNKELKILDLHIAIRDGCSVSRWEPTPKELEMLKAGGSIELWIMGRQPPVALQVVPHAEAEF